MSLLKGFANIETSLPPCHPGEVEWLRAEAALTDDISPAFPYLNALMKGTIYDPKNETLNFHLGGRGVTLHARKAVVTRLQDREDAEKVLERLRKLINRTYNRRGQIEPSYKSRTKLTVLELYRLLPKTNCGACGEPTCMAFAVKLASETVLINRCKPLFEESHAEARGRMLHLLAEAGYETKVE